MNEVEVRGIVHDMLMSILPGALRYAADAANKKQSKFSGRDLEGCYLACEGTMLALEQGVMEYLRKELMITGNKMNPIHL